MHPGPGSCIKNSIGNQGKNSNTSQFFITFAAIPKLSGKHVVFGRVVEGDEVLALIEASARSPDDAGSGEEPNVPVVIAACGLE